MIREAPAVAADGAPRPAMRPPEPGRFWVRYVPRRWTVPAHPWTDLAGAGLGAAGAAGAPTERGRRRGRMDLSPELSAAPATPLDDVLYLPPVPVAVEAERLDLAGRRLADGTPIVYQVSLGAGPASSAARCGVERLAAAGAAVVYDPLPALAAGGVERLLSALADPSASTAPDAGGPRGGLVVAGAAAVWPLVAGLSDGYEDQHRACDALAAAGLAAVQPLALQLSPTDRRRLAETSAGVSFHALFHRPAPAERAFAAVAAACGLAVFAPRPLPRPPLAGAGNRRLGELLALAGELWLRLGRPASQGQAYFRAARWVDGTGYDVAALAREGNLAVVDALDDAARELIAAALAGDDALPSPLPELLAAYTSAEAKRGKEEKER